MQYYLDQQPVKDNVAETLITAGPDWARVLLNAAEHVAKVA